MELRMAPAPLKNLRLESAATAPSSPHGRLGTSPFAAHDEGAAGAAFSTAPPSPNPFDLFHHITSAPASPRRAAAIYAHFAQVGSGRDGEEDQDDEEGDEEFQPRGSYATSVPFDWEERPGTPKAGLGGGGGAAWEDTDFEFGTFVDKSAPAQELTTADKLFEKGRIRPLKSFQRTADEQAEKGKIRPLKPPPGLLDGGSVASSPRSPIAKGGMMWSPRRRSRVSSGTDFDPFTAALLEATKAPSPLGGGKEANRDRDVASGSPPKKPPSRLLSRSSGWRWRRLSDVLLFRSSADAFRVSKDPVIKCSPPAQQPDAPPVKKTIVAQATATLKASGNGYDMSIKANQKQSNKSAAAAAEGVAGFARLSPLQRLAKGIGAYSWYHGRGMAAPGTKV